VRARPLSIGMMPEHLAIDARALFPFGGIAPNRTRKPQPGRTDRQKFRKPKHHRAKGVPRQDPSLGFTVALDTLGKRQSSTRFPDRLDDPR